MRKVFLAIAICSTFFFFSCGNEKELSLIMAEPNPQGSLSALVDEAFIQKVGELSGGKINIHLHANGILGDNREVIGVMTKGKSEIHLARLSPAAIASYNCTKQELLSVPYTFTSREHFWAFAKSPAAETILNEPYEKKVGVKGLFFNEEGFRHFFSTKKLTNIEDFKGEKIRTAGNEVMTGIIEGLHGEAITVSYSNLYSALQTGIVNIAEQPIANYLSNNFNKVAPYMILDGHELGVTEVVISSELWDSLSKEQKNIFIEASAYAGDYCEKISQELEDTAKLQAEQEGAQFIEVNDIVKWQKACADIINNTVKNNTVLYGEIITLAN